jgi:hypothetical protein
VTGVLSFTAADIHPDREVALGYQGIPPGVDVPRHIEDLYSRALEVLLENVEPVGIARAISKEEFATVYAGEGHNDSRTPVGDIFPRADHLTLFAVTLGETVNRTIRHSFMSNEFAAGSMLDAAASVAADTAADVIERRVAAELRADGRATPDTGVLRYSHRPHTGRELPHAAAQVRFGRHHSGTQEGPQLRTLVRLLPAVRNA